VRRLDEEASAAKLLESALKILECPRNCGSSCRGCLQDYSNQPAWDKLRRKPVQSWLKELHRDPVVESSQGRLWLDPSLATLQEMTKGASWLVLFADRLWTQGAEGSIDLSADGALTRMPAALVLLQGFLKEDASRHATLVVVDATPIPMHLLSAGAALALRELAILIDEGRLQIRQCPKTPNGLRLAIDPVRETGWIVHSSQVDIAIMEDLLPGVIRRLKLDEATVRSDLAVSIQNYPPIKSIMAWSASETRVTTYHVSQRRQYDQDFRDIHGARINRIEIRDPYALVENRVGDNIDSVAALLGVFSKISGQPIERVAIKTKPAFGVDDRRDRRQREKALDVMLKQHGLSGCKTDIVESREREFHDRWIDIEITRSTGQTEVHRYFLSGGIDRYMDMGRESVLVHIQQKVMPKPVAPKDAPPVPRPRSR